jgi:hypothetical protein
MKIADLWMITWVTGLRSLSQGGSSSDKKVLLQRYRDEFDIGSLKKFNTPAAPDTVLNNLSKEMIFSHLKNKCRIVLVRGTECT